MGKKEHNRLKIINLVLKELRQGTMRNNDLSKKAKSKGLDISEFDEILKGMVEASVIEVFSNGDVRLSNSKIWDHEKS